MNCLWCGKIHKSTPKSCRDRESSFVFLVKRGFDSIELINESKVNGANLIQKLAIDRGWEPFASLPDWWPEAEKLQSDGFTDKEIATILNDRGHTTKTKKKINHAHIQCARHNSRRRIAESIEKLKSK